MHSRTLTLGGLVGMAVLVGAISAVAQPPDRPMRGHRGPGGGAGERHLGLTDDQQAQFKQLREAQRPKLEALGKQLRENHQRLQQALEGAGPDPAAVGAIVIEGHGLRKQMRTLREDADAALSALLTEEQQVKFDALRALRRERRPMRAMGGAPFGPPPGEEP